jgi:Flp pilus assembly protein TadD
LEQARTAAQGRDYATAEKLAREVTQSEPDNVAALDVLGFALFFLGRYEEGEKVCLRTLELAPDHAYAHKGLGLCVAKRKATDQAVAHLKRAMEPKPDWFDPYWDLAVTLVEAGRWSEAVEVARSGRAAVPSRAADWDRVERHARAAGARAR